jgi:hypothetical protein
MCQGVFRGILHLSELHCCVDGICVTRLELVRIMFLARHVYLVEQLSLGNQFRLVLGLGPEYVSLWRGRNPVRVELKPALATFTYTQLTSSPSFVYYHSTDSCLDIEKSIRNHKHDAANQRHLATMPYPSSVLGPPHRSLRCGQHCEPERH